MMNKAVNGRKKTTRSRANIPMESSMRLVMLIFMPPFISFQERMKNSPGISGSESEKMKVREGIFRKSLKFPALFA